MIQVARHVIRRAVAEWVRDSGVVPLLRLVLDDGAEHTLEIDERGCATWLGPRVTVRRAAVVHPAFEAPVPLRLSTVDIRPGALFELAIHDQDGVVYLWGKAA